MKAHHTLLFLLFTIFTALSTSACGGNHRSPDATPSAQADTVYHITASADTGTAITPAGMRTVDRGANFIYTVTAEEGYRIGGLIIDGKKFDPFMTPPGKKAAAAVSAKGPIKYRFTNVQGDHAVHVVATLDTVRRLAIHVTSGAGGMVGEVNADRPDTVLTQPEPEEFPEPISYKLTAERNSAKHFAIVPAVGYDIGSILVDNKPYTPEPNRSGVTRNRWPVYTFDNIESDHTLRATFARKKRDK